MAGYPSDAAADPLALSHELFNVLLENDALSIRSRCIQLGLTAATFEALGREIRIAWTERAIHLAPVC
jgi:hypothetical protein